MTICKFFQTGNCRFGAKCANEHFDVRHLIKIEVEAAVNGNQWPLSCFGPFKEKPCFPNLIEDQSFEEIRYLCYESKKQNFFHNFQQQFSQQVIDAKNKMKTLLSLNREIIEIVTAIYDNPDGNVTVTGQQSSSQTSNPFSTISGGNNRDNSQQTANIFGVNNNNQPQQSNPFAKTTGNILNQSAFGNNLFGSSASTPQQQTSIFGGATNNVAQVQPQTNTFGGFAKPMGQTNDSNIFAQPTQNSIFGGNQGQQFGGIFGQQQQQPPQQQQQGNIFNQAANQTASGNIFGQTPQLQQQPNQTDNGFGSFLQQAQPFAVQQQPTGTFGQAPNNQQSNIFGATTQLQQPDQQAFQQQQPFQQNIFFQPPVQQQQQQQQPPPFQQQQQQSLFGNTPTQQEPLNFAQNNAVAAINPEFNQNSTQNSNQSQNIQSREPKGQVKVKKSSQIARKIYSKLEDLTTENIQQFQAEQFTLDLLPCDPPPKELCQSF